MSNESEGHYQEFNDDEMCGFKMSGENVPAAQSLFCTLSPGHFGEHIWRSPWQKLSTNQRSNVERVREHLKDWDCANWPGFAEHVAKLLE